MNPVLFDYPAASLLERPLPKNKLYEKGGFGPRQRELFVHQVERIVWQHKLAPETINLPAAKGIQEIQVFVLQLKGNDLDHEVLRYIDRAIPFPIVFELRRSGSDQAGASTQMAAAWKRAADGSGSPVPSRQNLGYFTSPWLPAHSPRRPLPLALDLAGLHEQMVKALIPLAPRPGEGMAQLLQRIEQVRQKQREIAQTGRQLEQEKQFNRKVPLNTHLRQLKIELEQLSR